MTKTVWVKINDELTEVKLDTEQVRTVFEAELREQINAILFEIMSTDYDEDDYPGLGDLVVNDDVTEELTDEVLREAESCVRRLAHDAVDRFIESHTQDYTVRIRATATVRALSAEAAQEVAEMLLDQGELSFEDTDIDVLE